MEKHLSTVALGAVLVATLSMPFSGLAYLSPDQVFGTNSDSVQQAPPLQREGEDVVAAQQQAAASRRALEQESLQSIDAEPVDTYVPPAYQASSRGLFDQDTQYELRQERANENSGSPTIIIGGNGDIIDSHGNVLHSGAPRVSATGPETMLSLTALLLALVSTFAYMQYRARMTVVA